MLSVTLKVCNVNEIVLQYNIAILIYIRFVIDLIIYEYYLVHIMEKLKDIIKDNNLENELLKGFWGLEKENLRVTNRKEHETTP